MYLIKQMALSKNLERAFIAEEGIKAYVSKHKTRRPPSVWGFWGTAEVSLGDNFDLTMLPKNGPICEVCLTYTNSYNVKICDGGFRHFEFFVDKYQPDNIEGYILFAEKVLADISTNGERIGGRYPNETVIVLREGQELKFTESEYLGGEVKTAKVVDGQLILTTVKK